MDKHKFENSYEKKSDKNNFKSKQFLTDSTNKQAKTEPKINLEPVNVFDDNLYLNNLQPNHVSDVKLASFKVTSDGMHKVGLGENFQSIVNVIFPEDSKNPPKFNSHIAELKRANPKISNPLLIKPGTEINLPKEFLQKIDSILIQSGSAFVMGISNINTVANKSLSETITKSNLKQEPKLESSVVENLKGLADLSGIENLPVDKNSYKFHSKFNTKKNDKNG